MKRDPPNGDGSRSLEPWAAMVPIATWNPVYARVHVSWVSRGFASEIEGPDCTPFSVERGGPVLDRTRCRLGLTSENSLDPNVKADALTYNARWDS